MYIVLLYRPEADENPGQRHGEHPFEGVEVVHIHVGQDPLDIDKLVDKFITSEGHKLHIEELVW